MQIPKKQSGFTHVLILLAILIIGAVAFGIFYLSKNKAPSSQPFLSAWDSLKPKAQKETGIYVGKNNTPRLVSGNFSGYESKKTPENIAWAFLEDNKSLYQIKNPKDELKIEEKNITSNSTNIKFAQYYKNIPVYGANIIVRITKDLKIDSVFSTYVPNIDISTKPKTTQEEAIKITGEKTDSKMQLVIYSQSVYDRLGGSTLTWLVEGKEENYFVSAVDGKILDGYATTTSALNREIYDDNENQTNPGTLWMNDKGVVAGLPAGKPDQEAQNTYKFSGVTYNYYSARLGRDSWDGKGATIVSSVHFRNDPKQTYNNASWKDGEKRIRFGTGWGNSLDIAAHEFTHGVTFSTSGLKYQGQSGALNESFADIFASFTGFYNGAEDWQIAVGPLNILRDMKKPLIFNQPNAVNGNFYVSTNPPCNSKNDWCGVHTNSGVTNKIAQVLTDGGVSLGYEIFPLGREKAEKLFYYILTERLNSTSQFIDLRDEMVEAAKSGFTGDGVEYTFTDLEKASIINAFAAAGIGSPDYDYDGKEGSNSKDGIAILLVKSDEEKIYKQGCGDPKETTIYALAHSYVWPKITDWGIKYRYENDNSWKDGGKPDKGPWNEAEGVGELNKEADWYKFKLENLPNGGSVKYKVYFSAKDGDVKVEAESGEFPINVANCTTAQSLKDVVKPNFSTKFSIIPTPTPTANSLTPTPTPQPTPISKATRTLTVHSDAGIDGFVSSNGRIGGDPVAGEYSPGARAFLSFDISALPSDAVISSAILSVNGAISSGDPFSLGNLSLIDYQFGTLDTPDYRADGSTIASILSMSRNSFDVANNIRSKVGSRNSKFQVRLQFDNTDSNNRSTDYITFPGDRMTLTVEYN